MINTGHFAVKYQNGLGAVKAESQNRFASAINYVELSLEWEECMDSWIEGTAEEKRAALTWIHDYRDRCVSAYEDVDDLEAMYTLAAVNYVELKSHWILLNTQINYQNANRGAADMGIAVRASMITTLLLALEEALATDDVDTIISFLSEPVHAYGSDRDDDAAVCVAGS